VGSSNDLLAEARMRIDREKTEMMVELTILNSMAGRDFEAALDQHVAWGLSVLDLKDAIFGKGIIDLTDDEAQHADALIRARKLTVYNFSTMFFFADVSRGEAWFKSQYLDKVDRLLAIAAILRPTMIRLLGAEIGNRREIDNSIPTITQHHPWLIPQYQEAVDRISAAGYQVTIENETGKCIFSNPTEVNDFFALLDRKGRACFTWDVQNLWELGTFPTLDVYGQLKEWIGFYHVKGGQLEGESRALRWRSALADASWPIVEITQQVVDDGISPVICLNPSHGAVKEGYDYANVTERDINFLRQSITGIR
jgi:sugar phosphate isomerase/epimerase